MRDVELQEPEVTWMGVLGLGGRAEVVDTTDDDDDDGTTGFETRVRLLKFALMDGDDNLEGGDRRFTIGADGRA